MQKNPLASLPILLLFFLAFKMHKLFNQLVILAICLAIILVVIYLVSIRIRDVGLARAMIPCVISDIRWYSARMGGLNVLDFAKITAFFIVAYFSFVTCVNKVSEKLFPPSIIALRLDIALTKLAKVEEKDIRCFQISPNCISIRHSARATFPETWYKENKKAIELPVGVYFTWFEFRPHSEVLAYFQYGIPHKNADILIEKPGGKMLVIKGNSGKYVYVLGDNLDISKCKDFKIGFVERFENIEQQRMKEAARWDSRFKHLIVVTPVNGRKDETAIHDKLDDYRLYGADEPGREIFVNAPEVRAMVQGWIDEMQASRNI